MPFIPSIQWPIIKYDFIKNYLDDIIFNPLFISHWSDLWLGYFVNNILENPTPLGSEFYISVKEHHPKNYNTINRIYDHILFLCFQKLNSSIYNNRLIPENIFKDISKKEYPDLDSDIFYTIYNDRLNFNITYKDSSSIRDIDYSFIICSHREKDECYIEEICEILSSYNYPSYEVLLFNNNFDYKCKNLKQIKEMDFGAAHGYNLCYKESRGKVIVELTDQCIPHQNIFNFISSPYKIRSLQSV